MEIWVYSARERKREEKETTNSVPYRGILSLQQSPNEILAERTNGHCQHFLPYAHALMLL